MRKVIKGLLTVAIILLVSTNAWALMVGAQGVYMEDIWTVPYQMTDIATKKTYDTFCLESKNYFTPDNRYDVSSVGQYAIGGGTGDLTDLGSGVFGDKIESQTKWLYAAYASDIFNINGAAALVQEAIWFWEKEAGGKESSWITLSGLGKGFDATGWDIVAVNLTLNGVDNQSQLVGVAPVPEPATMLLLGTGLIGMAGLGRKRLKK